MRSASSLARLWTRAPLSDHTVGSRSPILNTSILPFLSCPVPRAGAVCGGSPTLQPGGALPQRLGSMPEEIWEGSLHCGRCGTLFPILSGVAILVPQPEDYLRRYHKALCRDLKRHGDLSTAGWKWLESQGPAGSEEYGADFRFSQQFEKPGHIAQAISDDPPALYGPFLDWLTAAGAENPYDVLAEWSRRLPTRRGLALDTASSVGGLLARFGPHFGASIGVDLSFLAILLARRALLHLPEREPTYLISRRRGEEVERPLNLDRVSGAEFAVADCTRLPFASGLFDAVFSSNLIDIAPYAATLDEAARVTAGSGWLLLTDPFYFRTGEAPTAEPRQTLREDLAARGLEVKHERDGIPWVWGIYDRHWRLYFNFCLAAQKKSEPGRLILGSLTPVYGS